MHNASRSLTIWISCFAVLFAVVTDGVNTTVGTGTDLTAASVHAASWPLDRLDGGGDRVTQRDGHGGLAFADHMACLPPEPPASTEDEGCDEDLVGARINRAFEIQGEIVRTAHFSSQLSVEAILGEHGSRAPPLV